jgi:hypothetical protein
MGRSHVRNGFFGAARVLLLALAVVAGTQSAPAQSGAPALESVETGLGFSISLPGTWAKGQPAGNNKFVMGSRDDDFAVIVADFGPVQADAAAAARVYRDSFTTNGMAVETETDMALGGKTLKRFVLAIDTPGGAGHVDAVLLPVGDEVYAVMVVTPTASLDARRQVISKILESISLK